MPLSSYSGIFTISATSPAPSGLGNKSITGLGFQPKLVIFLPTARNGAGDVSDSAIAIGASTGNGNNYTGFVYRDSNNQDTTDSARLFSSTKCILMCDGDADTIVYSGTMVSMNADGFTINMDVASPSTRTIGFLALGGTDIENVEVGVFSLSTAAAGNTQDVTLGGSFKPNGLILLSACHSGATDVWSASAYASVGITDGVNQYGMSIFSADSQTAGFYNRLQKNTSVLFRNNISNTLDFEFSFNSFLSNGFRLNIDDAAAAAYKCIYIALKGPNIYAGHYTARGSAGDIVNTGPRFIPNTLFIPTTDGAAFGTLQGDQKLVLGVTTGTEAGRVNSNICSGIGAEYTADPTDSNTTLDSTKCSGQMRTTGGLAYTHVLKSFDAKGFTITQAAFDDLNIHPFLAIGNRSNIQIDVSAEWKNVNDIQVVVGGAWKDVNNIQLDNSAAWKTIV